MQTQPKNDSDVLIIIIECLFFVVLLLLLRSRVVAGFLWFVGAWLAFGLPFDVAERIGKLLRERVPYLKG